jgi:predicted LPLAT superfamily acyltransferase
MSEEPSKINNSSEYIYAKTIRLSTYIKNHDLEKIDVLKIDAEGSEFKIIQDLIETKVIDKIKIILYEDHARKIKSNIWKNHRKSVLKNMEKITKTKFKKWL